MSFSKNHKKVVHVLKLGNKEFVLGQLSFNSDINAYQIDLLVEEAKGVCAGKVTNVNAAESALLGLLEKAEKLFNCDLREIYFFVNNDALKTHRFFVEHKLQPQEAVSKLDTEEILQKSSTAFDLAGSELLYSNALTYRIDEGQTVKQPYGLYGTKLKADIFSVYCRHSDILPFIKLSNHCGLQVIGLSNEMLSAAHMALSEEKKDQGVALIDIGSDSTSAFVFKDKKLQNLYQIPIGADHITSDLMKGLEISEDSADQLKRAFGIINDGVPSSLEIDENNLKRIFMWRDSFEIVAPRVKELAWHLAKHLRSHKGTLLSGLVLMGGGALLKGLDDYFQDQLRVETTLSGAKISLQEVDLRIQSYRGLHSENDPLAHYSSLIAFFNGRMGEFLQKDQVSESGVKNFITNLAQWLKELS